MFIAVTLQGPRPLPRRTIGPVAGHPTNVIVHCRRERHDMLALLSAKRRSGDTAGW
jgi:hypothetical protein